MDNILRIVIEGALVVLLLCSLAAVIYAARRAAAKPLPVPDGAELFCVIAASGAAEQLEQTVKGLLWLGESGELRNRVIIADCGLDDKALLLAEIYAGKSERVTVCKLDGLPEVLEENGWMRVGST